MKIGLHTSECRAGWLRDENNRCGDRQGEVIPARRTHECLASHELFGKLVVPGTPHMEGVIVRHGVSSTPYALLTPHGTRAISYAPHATPTTPRKPNKRRTRCAPRHLDQLMQ